MTAQDTSVSLVRQPARARRLVEFVLLFVAAPIAHVAFYHRLGTFLPLAAMVAAGVALLAVTPGFRWRELVDLRSLKGHGPTVLLFALVAAAAVFGAVLWLIPHRLFGLPRYAPETWVMVMLLYPPISVLGQELLYRPLLFRRYGDLFPTPWTLVLASAATYALAHAFYQNWVALAFSFAGGLIFAEAYRRTGSFPLVFVLHTIAGQLVFTSGLGIYFYHGAIPG